MATRRNKRTALDGNAKDSRGGRPSGKPNLSASRAKLWLFRSLALVLAPLIFFALIESGLRLAGFGYSTAFLKPTFHQGREMLVQNNHFAWRYFGPQMGRMPEPIFISRHKSPETVRIFLFGESAAQGDPQPAFGPARHLEAILGLRYPNVRFEVVNAAMTAINSHVVRSIARDCAKAGGDIWVIYMGNNEVVGPFGAGTVFGKQTPPLALVRATLALKATRTGQLVDALLAGVNGPSPGLGEWRGMEMFLEQQVLADDPRMQAVYQNFDQNLNDIIRAGQSSGAGIVVSTVAVNLENCAPFASAHRPGLTESVKTDWDRAYRSGVEAQKAARFEEADREFAAAARLDSSFAELRFRQGTCGLAQGRKQEALVHFQAACDLDTLRFRCDSKLNDLIRSAVSNRHSDQILLADADRTFTEQLRDRLPATELFYEHVHLTFSGNYLLAKTLAEQVEKLLPARVVGGSTARLPWPAEADCARRLVWTDWSRLAALGDILVRVSSPPFAGQVNHDVHVRNLSTLMRQLSPALQPAGIAATRKLCETALANSPDDPILYGHLAALKLMAEDREGAVASAQRRVELLPTSSQAWVQLGLILFGQQKLGEAVATFQRAAELDPTDVMLRQNLAQSLWMLGRRDEAITQLRMAVKAQPNFCLGWISLGQLFDESGDKTEAEECRQRALACRPTRTADLVALARLCRSLGWQEAAFTNFNRAIVLNPQDAKYRLEAGQCLLALRRPGEAATLFADAVELAPELAQAHVLYGLALGQLDRAIDAERQFREAMRLAPDLLEVQLNLGIALMNQGRVHEARVQLEEVLRRSPTNALAARYLRELTVGTRAVHQR